jgi:hypothetical protein
MGYVHDTSISRFIQAIECLSSAGTWTHTVGSNLWTMVRTAADVAFTVMIPVQLPVQSSVALKGAYLKSVDIWYKVATGALDAAAATMYKMTLAADGAACTTEAVTTTYDTGHDAAAERIDVDEHKMTLTITTPFWVDDGEAVYVELVCDPAANSVFSLIGARANFTLRI